MLAGIIPLSLQNGRHLIPFAPLSASGGQLPPPRLRRLCSYLQQRQCNSGQTTIRCRVLYADSSQPSSYTVSKLQAFVTCGAFPVFDLSTSKWGHGLRVPWAFFLQTFSFLRSSVLCLMVRLGTDGQTDRQTDSLWRPL